MDEVVRCVEQEWFLKIEAPATRMWSDNGKEFANRSMYSLARKWGIEIQFGPPYSPWLNGLNERNHASADKAVNGYISDHPRASLQEAVNQGAWTHNRLSLIHI